MLYYIKLKNTKDGRPIYNEMGWKEDWPRAATVYDSKREANIAAFREGLDQDEFDIKLLYLSDIIDELRLEMSQMEAFNLIQKGDRAEMEAKYKEVNPICVPKGVIEYGC